MFRLKKFDFFLFLPAVFLLGLSLITIASVSAGSFQTHLVYILISLVFFLLFSLIDIEILLPLSPFIYVFCLVFLSLPLLVGTVTRGAVRWIPIAGFTIQPSEFVKPFLALFCAWFWRSNNFSGKRMGLFFFLFLPILILIFLQPDLGSTAVVFSLFLAASLSLKKISLRQILGLILGFSLILPLFWFFLKDYQRLRVIHFINPYADPLGEGYNLIQAKIAVGSGGFMGRGIGKGTQSHLAFLPERQTDFIFASLAEELGWLGCLAILGVYFFLFRRILKIAEIFQSENQAVFPFFILTLCLFCSLCFQTVVNIAMNIGLLPITGVTLPLISYGGSSLSSTMISLGIVQSLWIGQKTKDAMEIS